MIILDQPHCNLFFILILWYVGNINEREKNMCPFQTRWNWLIAYNFIPTLRDNDCNVWKCKVECGPNSKQKVWGNVRYLTLSKTRNKYQGPNSNSEFCAIIECKIISSKLGGKKKRRQSLFQYKWIDFILSLSIQ